MKLKLKLFLSLRFNTNAPSVSLIPLPDKILDNHYEYDIDSSQLFKFSLSITNLVEPNSAVIIDKISINDIQLNHLDSFGLYRTSNGIKKTYGYMDEIGTYTFKIRYNPLVHNYLNYLIEK